MQRVVIAILVMICFLPWMADMRWLPKPASLVGEMCAMLVAVYVLAEGMRSRFENVRTSYFIVFGAVVVVMICGVILNGTEPGPTVNGIRNYFRYIPFFFLGAVFQFTETNLRQQLLVLALICIFQNPVAVYQILKEIQSATYWDTAGISGDNTKGTMQGASTLSMFLVAAIAMLIALQRRGFVSFRSMLLLFVLFLFPTTINETRATFLMLPATLLVTAMVLAKPGQRARNLAVTLFVIVMFAAIFLPIYDYLIQQRDYGATMWEFFTSEGRAAGYMARGVGVGSTTDQEAGRLEMITVPLEFLARDPLQLLFGLGLGSVSESVLGPQFTGAYHHLFRNFTAMTFVRVVLELGLLGVALVLTILWMVFRDARAVAAKDPGYMGAFAAGWTGVTTVIFIGFFYKDLTRIEQLAVPFWFYSGVVTAYRMRMEAHARAEYRAARAASRMVKRVRVG